MNTTLPALDVFDIHFTRADRVPERTSSYDSGVIATVESTPLFIRLLPPRRRDSGWTCEVYADDLYYKLWLDARDHDTPEDAVARAREWIDEGFDDYMRELVEAVRKQTMTHLSTPVQGYAPEDYARHVTGARFLLDEELYRVKRARVRGAQVELTLRQFEHDFS